MLAQHPQSPRRVTASDSPQHSVRVGLAFWRRIERGQQFVMSPTQTLSTPCRSPRRPGRAVQRQYGVRPSGVQRKLVVGDDEAPELPVCPAGASSTGTVPPGTARHPAHGRAADTGACRRRRACGQQPAAVALAMTPSRTTMAPTMPNSSRLAAISPLLLRVGARVTGVRNQGINRAVSMFGWVMGFNSR
jgi:hypothetical protein